MVVFSFRSVVRLALYDVLASSLSSCRFLPFPSPSPPHPPDAQTMSHLQSRARCTAMSTFCLVCRRYNCPARRQERIFSRVAPANDIMIIHWQKKGTRGGEGGILSRHFPLPGNARCRFLRASRACIERLILSFFRSFFLSEARLDMFSFLILRISRDPLFLGGRRIIIGGKYRKEFDTRKHGRVCKF